MANLGCVMDVCVLGPRQAALHGVFGQKAVLLLYGVRSSGVGRDVVLSGAVRFLTLEMREGLFVCYLLEMRSRIL